MNEKDPVPEGEGVDALVEEPTPAEAPGPGAADAPVVPLAEPLASAEEHQRATGTPDWLHAATVRRLRWGLGREMTRGAYEAEIAATATHTGER